MDSFQQDQPRPSDEAYAIRTHRTPHKAFLRRIQQRVENELDAVILITGPEGYTKSTCARHIGRLIDDDFSEKNVQYTVEGYLEAIRDLPRGSVVIGDEGVEMLHNRNSMKKENKITNEVLMECRIMGLVHLFCFPRFDSVDIYLRDFRVWAWIRCLKPGVAEVRIRNWEVPVGDRANEAKQAYYPVCNIEYPKLDTPEWDDNKQRKEEFIEDKITEALEQ